MLQARRDLRPERVAAARALARESRVEDLRAAVAELRADPDLTPDEDLELGIALAVCLTNAEDLPGARMELERVRPLLPRVSALSAASFHTSRRDLRRRRRGRGGRQHRARAGLGGVGQRGEPGAGPGAAQLRHAAGDGAAVPAGGGDHPAGGRGRRRGRAVAGHLAAGGRLRDALLGDAAGAPRPGRGGQGPLAGRRAAARARAGRPGDRRAARRAGAGQPGAGAGPARRRRPTPAGRWRSPGTSRPGRSPRCCAGAGCTPSASC